MLYVEERMNLHYFGRKYPKGRGTLEDRSAGVRGLTRQQALNLWICGGIYVILSALSACRIAKPLIHRL